MICNLVPCELDISIVSSFRAGMNGVGTLALAKHKRAKRKEMRLNSGGCNSLFSALKGGAIERGCNLNRAKSRNGAIRRWLK